MPRGIKVLFIVSIRDSICTCTNEQVVLLPVEVRFPVNMSDQH
jgi:hypothetical protein